MTAKIKNCTYAAVLTIVAALCLMLGACADKGGSGARATKVGEVSVLGAGGYGAVFDGQIDPFAPDCFGAICDMGSCYFSFDRGESWTRHDLKGTLHCLEYDPSAEGVVWAAGSGVFKSEDHGRTMRMVFPKQAEVASAGNNYENVNYWIYTDGASDYAPQYQIWSMAIDRSSEGKNVFVGQRVPAAGFGYAQSIRIYRTANGEDFSLFGEYDYSYNFKLDFDESRDCLVLVTERGIYEINMDGEIEFSLEMPVVVQHSSGNTMSFTAFTTRGRAKTPSLFPRRRSANT